MAKELTQKELRLGVVLYGGVSLAVYMNGVVTELWYLLRASRHRVDKPGQPADDLCVQRYVALLDALAEAPGGRDLRVVVDTIAGTSAGGVNGTVLAKAIVEGADAEVLNRVWIDDADIAKLRDEPPVRAPLWLRTAAFLGGRLRGRLKEIKRDLDAIEGLSFSWARDQVYANLKGVTGGRTPLSGDYFCEMIARTLKDMGHDQHDRLLPNNNAFDLYLTATDLHGWPRHLPVSREFHETPLYERAHAHVSHFRVEPQEPEESGDSEKPGESGKLEKKRQLDDFHLTFATRATAGFPVAFAPLNYTAAVRGFKNAQNPGAVPTQDRFLHEVLAEHSLCDFPCDSVRMVDGGFLDNKPFSHVVSAIEGKVAQREVYRCILYLEPDPQPIPRPPEDRDPSLRELGGAIYALFRHEPVVEDLRRLQDRNTKAAAIRRIRDAAFGTALTVVREAGIEVDASSAESLTVDQLAEWRQRVNKTMAERSLGGYEGYLELKVRRVLALQGETLCRVMNFPYHSRQAFLMRLLLRIAAQDPRRGRVLPMSMKEDQPPSSELRQRQETFLSSVDLPFRERRLWFLVATANRLYREHSDRAAALDSFKALDAFKEALAKAMNEMRRKLRFSPLREGEAGGDDISARSTKLMQAIKALDRRLGPRGAEAGVEEGRISLEGLISESDFSLTEWESGFEDTRSSLCGLFEEAGQALNGAVAEAIKALPDALRQELTEAFVAFPLVDAAIFPLMDAAGIEDPAEVRVMRISPDDGKVFAELPDGRPGLKSAPLGAFAGFLDKKAREHDLLWGRLDGAERLVDLLLKASGVQMNSEIRLCRCGLLYQIVEEQKVDDDSRSLLQQLRDLLIVERFNAQP